MITYRRRYRWRGRHLFAAVGLRPPAAEHTEAEGRLLQRFAAGSKCAVELGVAEGGSAWEIRQVLADDGVLYLVDPYLPGRLFGVNMSSLVAHRLVRSVPRGKVEWVRKFSADAARGWDKSIDFLFIDANHSYEAVLEDWNAWTPHLRVGASVALHDARVFTSGWTHPSDGPVLLVRRLTRLTDSFSIVDEVDSTVVLRRAG